VCKAESKLRLTRAGTSTHHSVVLSTQRKLGPEFAFTWHRARANMSCLSAQIGSSGLVPKIDRAIQLQALEQSLSCTYRVVQAGS